MLREQLLSQVNNDPTSQPAETMNQASNPASPTDPSNIDPAIAQSGVMSTSADSDGGEGNGDGRKGYGKRELSTSKRAAQNRAAQVSILSACAKTLWRYRNAISPEETTY